MMNDQPVPIASVMVFPSPEGPAVTFMLDTTTRPDVEDLFRVMQTDYPGHWLQRWKIDGTSLELTILFDLPVTCQVVLIFEQDKHLPPLRESAAATTLWLGTPAASHPGKVWRLPLQFDQLPALVDALASAGRD